MKCFMIFYPFFSFNGLREMEIRGRKEMYTFANLCFTQLTCLQKALQLTEEINK